MATSVNIIVGSHVWVEDPVLAWIDGEVFKINGDDVHIHTTNGKKVVAKMSKLFPKDTEAPPGGVDDMTKLSYLHEPGVLNNLAARYELNEIYMESKVEVCPSKTLAYMELALEQAKQALDCLEVPIGCVIVEDGKVIASGRNRTTETRNATRHAEMEAIDDLLEQWQKEGLSVSEVADKFSKCTLYVTCEPCIMCAASLSILGMKDVFYGCANDKFGGCGSILSLHLSRFQPHESGEVAQGKGFKCTGGIMASEAVSLLRCFYEQGNPNAPKPHRPVTLQTKNP